MGGKRARAWKQKGKQLKTAQTDKFSEGFFAARRADSPGRLRHKSGKRAHGKEMARRWSRDGQGMWPGDGQGVARGWSDRGRSGEGPGKVRGRSGDGQGVRLTIAADQSKWRVEKINAVDDETQHTLTSPDRPTRQYPGKVARAQMDALGMRALTATAHPSRLLCASCFQCWVLPQSTITTQHLQFPARR